jgi:hypothetical protein
MRGKRLGQVLVYQVSSTFFGMTPCGSSVSSIIQAASALGIEVRIVYIIACIGYTTLKHLFHLNYKLTYPAFAIEYLLTPLANAINI